MTEPTNVCGWHIEAYTAELGWKACTDPVATRAKADKQLKAYDPAIHRVYHAINGYTLADLTAAAGAR